MNSSSFIMDLHNHTIYSDGENTTRQLIENAITNNIGILGISDHFEMVDNTIGVINYIDEINQLKNQYPIKLLAGLEISAFSLIGNHDDKLTDILNKLDYILIEEVDYFVDPKEYDRLKQQTTKLTCLRGLAHTDVAEMGRFNAYYHGGLEFILKFMQECNLFWELNVSSERKFFNMLYGNWDDTIAFINKLNERGTI